MASKSIIAREVKRQRLVDKYAAKRKALKDAGEWLLLDSCKCRLKNRCKLTGRPKGYVRMFGISRVSFRDLASYGKIPGVTKASWLE